MGEDIPFETDLRLNTATFDKMLPGLASFPPCQTQAQGRCSELGPRSMTVDTTALERPTVNFIDGKVVASVKAKFDFYVNQDNSEKLLALSVSTTLEKSASPVIVDKDNSAGQELKMHFGA